MIWIWLLAKHAQRWATGPLDRYFAFLCARCGVTTAAMVRTFGHGTGATAAEAERSAHAAANVFAFRAVSAAACPHCGELQPSVLEQFARAIKSAASARVRRVPITLAVVVLVALALAIPAVHDLQHSFWLSIVAISAAAASGALVFAALSGAVPAPSTDPTGVWFSRDPAHGPASWFPAQPGHAPLVPQPSPLLRKLSLVALAVTTLSASSAIAFWRDTYRTIYVVSAEGPARGLEVRIDGASVGSIVPGASTDAPFGTFEVRTSTLHRVVVVDADHRETSYELDPAKAKDGWLLAPRSREHGLCVAEIKWFYGKAPPKDYDGDHLLNGHTDLVVLPHSFDYVFTQPPSTIQTKNGSSETRTSLRALNCAALAKENVVPFRDGPWRAAPEPEPEPAPEP